MAKDTDLYAEPNPESPMINEHTLGAAERLKAWEPSLAYKAGLGTLAATTALFAGQNVDTFHRWENAHSSNFYPAAPAACHDFVDTNRDLGVELPVMNTSQDAVIAIGLSEARALRQQEITDFIFNPGVGKVRSASTEFDQGDLNLQETKRQAEDFFEFPVESFVMPSSGLQINVFSSTSEPGFTIDHGRFDELFHAPLSEDLNMQDKHYAELLNCSRVKFGKPDSMDGESLDVFIVPELGYCIGSLRIVEINDNPDGDNCVAQAATPPHLLLEFAAWDLINEEAMILTFQEKDDPGKTIKEINRLLLHEAAHYWRNAWGEQFELHPEEKFASAIHLSALAYNVAGVDEGRDPAIIYFDFGEETD